MKIDDTLLDNLDMNTVNEIMGKIKAGSPVHKINFTLESPNAVVGMYLITMGDTESYLKKFVDLENLNEDTLLVFESRHVVECCQIIYGCLNILKNINMYRMKYDVLINEVMDTLLSKPSFYKNTLKELTTLTYGSIHTNNTEETSLIYKKFLYIMQNIWFVPYGYIDQIAKEAIEEFKKYCEDGESNE